MSFRASIGRRAARRLEAGSFRSWPARGLAAVWQRASSPVRRVHLPAGVRVVGIGGATLGGAGKTPLVLELARALAQQAAKDQGQGRAPVAVVASAAPNTHREALWREGVAADYGAAAGNSAIDSTYRAEPSRIQPSS